MSQLQTVTLTLAIHDEGRLICRDRMRCHQPAEGARQLIEVVAGPNMQLKIARARQQARDIALVEHTQRHLADAVDLVGREHARKREVPFTCGLKVSHCRGIAHHQSNDPSFERAPGERLAVHELNLNAVGAR